MKLQQIIRDRGLKQNWIAGKIGISQTHFSEMLRGIKRFPIEKIEPLADVLQMPVKDVVRAVSRKEAA